MHSEQASRYGAGVVLAIMLATSPAFAQDADEEDELMPAVDTSAMVEEEDKAARERAAEQDVTRTTSGNRVMDTMELSRTQVHGNQELPKVLYIVPWQKSNPGDLMGRPVNTLLDEVLAPLDRDEFRRQVEYFNDIKGDEE
jgi:phage tail sheath gpL-like